MTAGETHGAIEAIFRIERARLIAGLARVVRNVDLAEELAQDALVMPCPNGLGPAFRPIPAIV
jgi:predicted RNA polymerase sigma factor